MCTQWGFFMVRQLPMFLAPNFQLSPLLILQTPPPDPTRPRIISNLLTVEYAHLICNLVRTLSSYAVLYAK